MIDEFNPVKGLLSLPRLKKWLMYARKLDYAYLLVIKTKTPESLATPFVVRNTNELFDSFSRHNERFQDAVVEVYNPRSNLDAQIENPLVIRCTTKPNPNAKRETEACSKFLQQNFQTCDLTSAELSQFDQELWFYWGTKFHRKYMLIVCDYYPFSEYYPVYCEARDLWQELTKHTPGFGAHTIAVYDLEQDFDQQYCACLYSSEASARKLEATRAEQIAIFNENEELDGLRRRIWDFFTFCQLESIPDFLCFGAAQELINYTLGMHKEHRKAMGYMLCKAVTASPDTGAEGWKVMPYQVILEHLKLCPFDLHPWRACYSSNQAIRHLAMLCRSLFKSKFQDYEHMFGAYYCDGYELRYLLHLIWTAKGSAQDKKNLIQRQLKLEKDPFCINNNLPLPTADHKLEIRQYEHPGQVPNPFAEDLNRYRAFLRDYYYREKGLYYALHIDPTPRLDLPRERKQAIQKAKAGDLTSILSLAAYYMWCDSENHYLFEYGDYPSAIRWIKKGVEYKHPTAICLLGYCYLYGYGIEYDRQKAYDCLSLAADMGYALAYLYLSQYYNNETGHGESDFVKAYAYLLVADWALVDGTGFRIEEELSHLYWHHLDEEQRAQAVEIAHSAYSTLKVIDSEPANHLGPYYQKALDHDLVRDKWRREFRGTESLPVTFL